MYLLIKIFLDKPSHNMFTNITYYVLLNNKNSNRFILYIDHGGFHFVKNVTNLTQLRHGNLLTGRNFVHIQCVPHIGNLHRCFQ